MLISIALILLAGIFAGQICKKCKFPALFGMIIAGIIIGPYGLNMLDKSILNISSELRRIALIIILIRAGLKLNLNDLKKQKGPAIMMCFVPACFEIIGMIILAPVFFGISRLDAAILGAVVAAVSPAVVVPRMIRLIDEEKGTDKGIPQIILAGASVDDVFVIVMLTTFMGMAKGEGVSLVKYVNIPVSIITGILAGLLVGIVLYYFFDFIKMSKMLKIAVVLSVCFILNWIEETESVIPFTGLIAIMALGTMIRKKNMDVAKELSGVFDNIWTIAEIFLFVLVGASVAVSSLKNAGLSAILLLMMVLVFRMIGVFVCVLNTNLTFKEKLFCMLAYTPKATVQAAVGGLPLAAGLGCGEIVLTVSVIAILLTAPLGAFAIDYSYKKWL